MRLPFSEKFNFTLVANERELFPANGGIAPVDNEAMEIFAGDKVLLCLGIITYLDESNRKRETGFCRRYRPREQQWETIEDPNYEYSD